MGKCQNHSFLLESGRRFIEELLTSLITRKKWIKSFCFRLAFGFLGHFLLKRYFYFFEKKKKHESKVVSF